MLHLSEPIQKILNNQLPKEKPHDYLTDLIECKSIQTTAEIKNTSSPFSFCKKGYVRLAKNEQKRIYFLELCMSNQKLGIIFEVTINFKSLYLFLYEFDNSISKTKRLVETPL